MKQKPSDAITDPAADDKISTIAHHFGKIMEALGLDLGEPGIAKTPERVAKMYVEELFCGLDPENFPPMTYLDVPVSEDDQSLIVIKDIAVRSTCEHHFVPFTGHATVAYVPNQKVVGLSKINRLVDYFCRRPQIQERLTVHIADTLSRLLGTNDVAVIIQAEHYCVTMRGVQDACSSTRTQILRGRFKTDDRLYSQLNQ